MNRHDNSVSLSLYGSKIATPSVKHEAFQPQRAFVAAVAVEPLSLFRGISPSPAKPLTALRHPLPGGDRCGTRRGVDSCFALDPPPRPSASRGGGVKRGDNSRNPPPWKGEGREGVTSTTERATTSFAAIPGGERNWNLAARSPIPYAFANRRSRYCAVPRSSWPPPPDLKKVISSAD